MHKDKCLVSLLILLSLTGAGLFITGIILATNNAMDNHNHIAIIIIGIGLCMLSYCLNSYRKAKTIK